MSNSAHVHTIKPLITTSVELLHSFVLPLHSIRARGTIRLQFVPAIAYYYLPYCVGPQEEPTRTDYDSPSILHCQSLALLQRHCALHALPSLQGMLHERCPR